MGVLEEYQGASFRGVPFLVPNESEDTGQKPVSHEYPNSDERFVEQLGKIPSTFKMEGIVKGNDAIQQRIRLREALNTPGLGDLVHPIYGTVRVKALPFSIRSSQTRMGEFVFSLEFAVSKENVTPSPETPTEQSVTQASLSVNFSLGVALQNNYVEPDGGSLLDTSANKTIDATTDVQTKINASTNLDPENASTFNRVADAILNNALIITQSADDLSENMGLLISAGLEVVDAPSELREAWTLMLSFGIGPNGITSEFDPVNTVSRLLAATNSNLLDEWTRLVALANLYEAIAYTDFTTVDKLTEAQKLLDDKHKNYLEDAISLTAEAGLVSIATDPEVRRTFIDLRNVAREAINTKSQNLWRVVSISPGRSSMALTAYRYYGNLDQLDLIKELNSSVNVGTFNEDELSAVSK